jgi:CheY-like chemotaxis protein
MGVTMFNHPLEAKSKFRAGIYDFVLLDVRMPRINGFERIRILDGRKAISGDQNND